MPRDGSGVYSLPAGYLAVNGDIIQPSQHNPPLEDIANALTNSLPRNGAAAMTGDLKMGGYKVTGMADGTVATDGVAFGQLTPYAVANVRDVNDFRLTLSATLPVSVADITGASTIYCAPYTGNQISLYVSGAWVVRTSAQFSLALSGLVSGRPYDVFCYDNATVPTLEFLAWTNDTTRATALTRQDGRLVKSGDATRRYLGSFYTTAATTTEDSAGNRYLWNYYHRVVSFMERKEATSQWNYSVATWRQANASTANQVNFIVGVGEDAFHANVIGVVSNSGANASASVAIGYDSTTVPSGVYSATDSSATASGLPASGSFSNSPVEGRHFFAWLEISRAIATGTFYGVNGGASKFLQSGISAMGMR